MTFFGKCHVETNRTRQAAEKRVVACSLGTDYVPRRTGLGGTAGEREPVVLFLRAASTVSIVNCRNGGFSYVIGPEYWRKFDCGIQESMFTGFIRGIMMVVARVVAFQIKVLPFSMPNFGFVGGFAELPRG